MFPPKAFVLFAFFVVKALVTGISLRLSEGL